MKDPWNTAGVDWSNEHIERELARVEQRGRWMADRFVIEKMILLAIATLVLYVCIDRLPWLFAVAAECAILLVVIQYLRRSGRKTMEPMYQLCDPYLEFAYVRAYAQKKLLRTRISSARQILSMGQCMALAGQTDAALEILKLLELEVLPASEQSIYYNTLLLCYGQYGWSEKRAAVLAEVRKKKEDAKPRQVPYWELILRLEEVKRRQDMGDIEYVEDHFQKAPPVYCFQAVGMHYSLGMMYMKAGDAENARPHVEFVLDNGNKLYYKKNLEDYLRSSLEEGAGRKSI